jgi:hypothetical protein
MRKRTAIVLSILLLIFISGFAPTVFSSDEEEGVVISDRAKIAKIAAGDFEELKEDSDDDPDDSVPVVKSANPAPVIGARPVRNAVTVGAMPNVNRDTVGAMPVSPQPVVGMAIGMQSPTLVKKGDGVPQDSEIDVPAEDKPGSGEAF